MEKLSIWRANGVLNASNWAYLTQGTVVKSRRVPNFEAVNRFIEFINMEFNRLTYQATQDIHDPAMINVESIIAECKLPYSSVTNLVSIITDNGLHGELDNIDTSYVHLTKMWLWNLLQILLENTEAVFVNNGLISESDIQGKSKRVILDKSKLLQLVISRGLHEYVELTPTKMVNSITSQLRVGEHYELSQNQINPRLGPTKVLTLKWIEFLTKWINLQVLFLLQLNSFQNKKAA